MQTNIFSEKDIQFELFSEYFFSICDFIEKSKTIRPSLSHEELVCEPYILHLQCNFSVNNSSFLKQLDLGNEKSELQEMLIDRSLDRLLYSKFPTVNSNEYLQDCNFCSYKDQLGDKARFEKVKNFIGTKLFHKNDGIFDSFVGTLNVHFINELMRKKVFDTIQISHLLSWKSYYFTCAKCKIMAL